LQRKHKKVTCQRTGDRERKMPAGEKGNSKPSQSRRTLRERKIVQGGGEKISGVITPRKEMPLITRGGQSAREGKVYDGDNQTRGSSWACWAGKRKKWRTVRSMEVLRPPRVNMQ